MGQARAQGSPGNGPQDFFSAAPHFAPSQKNFHEGLDEKERAGHDQGIVAGPWAGIVNRALEAYSEVQSSK